MFYNNLNIFMVFILFAVAESKQIALKRIIGGRPAYITEFPYQAEIEIEGSHVCGAIIIHTQFLLTAAHCVIVTRNAFKRHATLIPPEIMAARVGMSYAMLGGQSLSISQVIVHEKNNNQNPVAHNDIALVVLEDKIILSARAQVVPIAKKRPKAGEIAYATGFGYTGKSKKKSALKKLLELMVVELPILSLPQCRRKMEALDIPIGEDQICAGSEQGKDTCYGDSGGPLVVNNYLVGIVSWGFGCGWPNIPGIYTNVPFHYKWIRRQIRNAEIDRM